MTVAAVCDRHYAEDCLLSTEPIGSIDRLGEGVVIGTSSLRRIAQLKHVRPDLEFEPIRGNVRTRVEKLRTEDLDAIILARAGLERLGLDGEICFSFDPTQFTPAPAQGALAVQTRADDATTCEIVASIDDERTRALTDAERQVDAQHREMRLEPGVHMMRAPSDGRPFILSNRDPDEIRQRYKWWAWFHLATFVAASVWGMMTLLSSSG